MTTTKTPRWLQRHLAAAHDTDAERETFAPARLADGPLKAAYVPVGRSRAGIARFQRKLADSAATAKVVILGDSTAEETNYPQTYARLRTFHTTPGQAFAGMTPANIVEGGNSGLSLQAWLTGTNGDFRPSDLWAAAPDLVIVRFLTNDTRLGSRTQAQMAADLTTLVGTISTNLPDADVLIATPPTLTTTVVGADYLSAATQGQAQARSDAMRLAVLSLRDMYPHVMVVDAAADVWGIRVNPTSPLMGDQLHPNQAGQEAWADYIARKVAEMGRTSGLAPAGARFETERLYVWSAGNGFIDVGKWNSAPGPEGRELPLTTSDTLYSSDSILAPVSLSGATFVTSGNNTRILKAGDWTAYASKAAVITGDHPAEGVRGGKIVVTGVDPASIAAGATLDVTFTVTGARSGMGVVCDAPGQTAGIMVGQARVSGTDQVSVRLHNTTGSAIDPASGTWTFWLAR